MRNFFRELAVGCGSTTGKNYAIVGGWPVEHPCIVSELSGMLGNLVNAHENCTVFRASSRMTD